MMPHFTLYEKVIVFYINPYVTSAGHIRHPRDDLCVRYTFLKLNCKVKKARRKPVYRRAMCTSRHGAPFRGVSSVERAAVTKGLNSSIASKNLKFTFF